MSIYYEIISDDKIHCIENLCNELMAYQKSKSSIHPEWFDNMSFETRMIPSFNSAKANFIIVAKDDNEIVGYAYSNICPKHTYSGGFATLESVDFFDFDSVKHDDVGCISQFYIKEDYRNLGIGSILFTRWLYYSIKKYINLNLYLEKSYLFMIRFSLHYPPSPIYLFK